MEKLIEYIVSHVERGECQCGKCCDKLPDREAPRHSVDAGFFWVSPRNEPTAAELNALLRAEYPDAERLKAGPSYIEIGGVLGSQELAIMLIGLGELVGIWKVASPKDFGLTGPAAQDLLGGGFLMPAGWNGLAA